MHRFGSNSPSEKLQIKILLIDTPQTVLIMFKIQILRKGAREGCVWGFHKPSTKLRSPDSVFPNLFTGKRPHQPARGRQCFSRMVPHTPTPQTQTHPDPANGSGLSEHAAACSVPITLMVINERLDNLISRVITL